MAALWHAPRSADALLAKFEAATPTIVLDPDQWWQQDWAKLPDQRNESDIRRRWPLDVQVAGRLEPLRARLVAQGWRVQPQADWVATVGLLDDDTPADEQPVLPATLDAHAETLLLLHDGRTDDEQYALRLWQAPAVLHDGAPLWLGSTQTLRLSRPLGVAALWLPERDDGQAHAMVKVVLGDFESREAPHPSSGTPVLRLRTSTTPRSRK